MGCSHCLLQFSANESCIFPIPSWFPSIQAPTDSTIPSSQCFLLQSCSDVSASSIVMAPIASAFCKLLHTRFHALMRYSNSMSIPIIATVCPQRFSFPPTILDFSTSAFPTSVYQTDFATSPYLVVAYPLWGFTASFVNNTGLGYSVGGWRISAAEMVDMT
jgi:hypothetical protein